MTARFLARWELQGVTGAIVAVDVIRAFTTAAYAFGAGAEYIEQIRTGLPVDEAACIDRVANSSEAVRTLLLGDGNAEPDDIVFATRIDAFKFSMEVVQTPMGLCIQAKRR